MYNYSVVDNGYRETSDYYGGFDSGDAGGLIAGSHGN